MQITASWSGRDVEVEVDEECRSLAALKHALRSALPEEVDLEKVCLEVCGRAMEEEDVVGLVEGSVVAVSPTLAACAADALREEGRVADAVAFRVAAEAGDLRLCKLYCDAGTVIPAGEETPLHIACRYANIALCTLLLNRGADVNAKELYGNAPLHVAVQIHRKRLELCTLLLDCGADVNAKRPDGNAPLHVAVQTHRKTRELCTLLLDRGCDINIKGPDGKTPLHLAASSGRTELCTLLLDRGADVNAKGSDHKTPLHLALVTRTNLCPFLLDRGADVNARDSKRKTPLHFAAVLGSTKLCRLLLDRGADVNVRGCEGLTPLELATLSRCTELCTLLIDSGSVKARDHGLGRLGVARRHMGL